MKKKFAKSLVITIIVSFLVGHIALAVPSSGVSEVQAATPNINIITGLFRSFSALNKRNRVYAEARSTAQEVNAHYDAQIATAQRLRQELISQAVQGEKNRTFVRSYVRATAALQEERRALLYLIELEKNKARQEFNRRLGNEIKNILLSSPGGNSILSNVKDTIQKTREAAAAVQAAANIGDPAALLTQVLTDKLGDTQTVRNLAQELGSDIGNKIDRALDGAITKIDHALSDIKNEMGDAIALLDSLEQDLAQAQNQIRYPVSPTGNNSPDSIRNGVDHNNVWLDVTALAYTIASERSGNLQPGETRLSMYDRIRSSLQMANLTNTIHTLLGEGVGNIYCIAVSRADYETAAYALGAEVQVAQDPEQARYMVCYDVETNEPKVARMLESKFTAATEESSDEGEQSVDQEATAEPETMDLSACFAYPGDYSWGYDDIERHDCLDLSRCTGCGGTFFVQNNSNEDLQFKHYFYQNFSTPNFDGWKQGYQTLQPGERWETDVSISNRWKEGITYRSSVVKIALIIPYTECLALSDAQLDSYAIPIDPLPCE